MDTLIHQKEKILNTFTCQQSGNCCRCPGYVYVTQHDITNMAHIKECTSSEFKTRYTQQKKGWSLIASPTFRTHCFLNKKNQCTVYNARPSACKTYPNWPHIWKNDTTLLNEAKKCPGLRKTLNQIKNQTSTPLPLP